jgi:curved DNA-binding protein CbpA
MQNPYEVLGLREGASIEEVKRAYRELVKKYHPDQYANNPLRDLAEQKMREINEAYRTIMEGNAGGVGFNGNSAYDEDDNLYREVIEAMNRNDIFRADTILNRIRNRSARWYYFKGHINYRRNRFGDAYDCFRTAVNMDPNNPEYRDALNNMMGMADSFRRNVYHTTNRNDDCCQALCTLWLCDTCCECMGGDLCRCF